MGRIYEHQIEKTAKPWGSEQLLIKTDKYAAKILSVTSREKLSVQHHEHKEETMIVQSGKIIMHYGYDVENLTTAYLYEGDIFHIPPGLIHSVEAIEDATILEVSSTELNDIIRHEDRYGRA